jgi:hypothetical protein
MKYTKNSRRSGPARSQGVGEEEPAICEPDLLSPSVIGGGRTDGFYGCGQAWGLRDDDV